MAIDYWRGVSAEVRKKIEETGIDFGFMADNAAKIVTEHGDRGIEALKRFVEGNEPTSVDSLYFTLREHGTDLVLGFLKKFGSENFEHASSILSSTGQYGSTRVSEFLEKFGIQNSDYLNDYLSAQDEFGEDITDGIAREYGIGLVKLVSPHYQRDSGIVSRIFERFGTSNSPLDRLLLEKAFLIYERYEQAKEEGGDVGQYGVTFRGHVQDVGFRSAACTYGKICELTGTVKNMNDGNVKAIVQGTRPLVECFNSSLNDHFKSSSEITQQQISELFQDFTY